MALDPPIPGLRPLHYDARSPAKVQLIVQPGDELVVSDDVADQLQRQSLQFKSGDVMSVNEAREAADEPADEPAAAPAPRRRRKPQG